MSNMIFIVCLLFTLLQFFVNYRNCLMYYCVFSLVCPHFHYGSYTLPFEIIGFFIILFGGFMYLDNISKKISIRTNHCVRTYFGIIFVYLFATLLSVIILDGSVQYLVLFGICRLFIVLLLLFNTIESGDIIVFFDKVLSAILFINTAAVFLQVIVPSTASLFNYFYYQPEYTPLEVALDLGGFSRAYGTFPSPTLLGAWSLFMFAFFYGLSIEGLSTHKHLLKIVLCIFCGIAALSKIAIIGVPVLFLFGLIFTPGRSKNKTRIISICTMLLIILFLVTVLVPVLSSKGYPISWYLRYLSDPLSSFDTRYNSSNDNFVLVLRCIGKSPLFGYGATNPYKLFIGDSDYLCIPYQTGILGFAGYLYIVIRNMRRRSQTSRLVTIAFLCIGFGVPGFFGLLGIMTLTVTAHTSAVETPLKKKPYKWKRFTAKGVLHSDQSVAHYGQYEYWRTRNSDNESLSSHGFGKGSI